MQIHHVEINCPDVWSGWKSTVHLDGKPLYCKSVTAKVSSEEVTEVTIVLEAKVNWKTEDEASNVQAA